jgi:lysozyme
VRNGRYQQAAAMMLESRWAGQVGQRAQRLSQMMATGRDPAELRRA